VIDVWNIEEKSAEVIVVDSNEPCKAGKPHKSMKD